MTEARAFNVTLTEHADGIVVRVTGEVDIVTAPLLQRHLDAAVATGKAVAVDLSDTTFLDARGVAALVNTRKQLTRTGGRLVVRRPGALVRRVLELAEQADRIEIED